MHNNSPPFKLPDGEAGGLVVHQHALLLWWSGLPTWVRSPVWPALLAALTILGLLLSFHQVVYQAVQQSELRHRAGALHSEATWRCNTMSSQRASEGCLSQLKAYSASAVRTPNAHAVLVTSLELLSNK
jgi:hypothetical protein